MWHLRKSGQVGHHGLDEQKITRIPEVHTWTKISEEFPSRIVWRKNKGTIKVK
jgi:hypothetical protein